MAPKTAAAAEPNGPYEVDVLHGEIELSSLEIPGRSDKLIVKKIDRWLMPLMALTYMLQFLDKQTLSQTSIMGFIEDLSLTGNQFSWAGSIFYFGYLAFTYPAALLLVRFPIAKYLTVVMFIWTVILVCHAALINFAGVMALRFLLWAAEASISPGFTLLTGMWYTREEQPLRYGLWFAGSSAASAFGGLICFGIAHIHASIETWKLLYVIYGAITLLWTAVIYHFLPDEPDNARFLTRDERARVIQRIRENQTGVKENVIRGYQVWEALTDYKVWLLVLYQLSSNIPNGAMLVFAVLVTKGFGFTELETYLIQIPIGAAHALFALGSTWLASRFTNSRCILAGITTLISLLGCLLIYKLEGKVVSLIGILLYMASVAGMPLSFSLISANTGGFTKRATVSAMILIAYCVGNIIGPFLFFEREAPHYKSGYLSIIICFCVAVASIGALAVALRNENRRRDRLTQEAVVSSDGNDSNNASTKQDIVEITGEVPDLTDKENLGFRYVY